MMSQAPVIVLIDDDPAALASVSALLGTLEHELQPFASAEAFLASDHHGRQGCILSDVRLSGMSGLVLLHHLAKLDHRWEIILITGYADPQMACEALNLGALAVLEKPIDPEDLLQQVRSAML